MPTVHLEPHSDFLDWRPLARYLLTHDVPPDQVSWQTTQDQDLFAQEDIISLNTLAVEKPSKDLKINRSFLDLARLAGSHTDPGRFDTLYRLLWRIYQGERNLLCDTLDPLVNRANQFAKQVGRDRHKMRAFVRFREITLQDINTHHGRYEIQGKETSTFYAAWFEPEYYILRLNSEFFCRRFHNMDWAILTPYQSLHWQKRQLRVGSGADPSQVPPQDAMDDYWRCYYANIFNPARLKIDAMCSEMPKKYWHNLPEATLIPQLINSAHGRTQTMLEAPTHKLGKLPKGTLFKRQDWIKTKHSQQARVLNPSEKC